MDGPLLRTTILTTPLIRRSAHE